MLRIQSKAVEGVNPRSQVAVSSCFNSRMTSRPRMWFERRASSDASPFRNTSRLPAQMLKRSTQSVKYLRSASTPSGRALAVILDVIWLQTSRKCRLVWDASVKIGARETSIASVCSLTLEGIMVALRGRVGVEELERRIPALATFGLPSQHSFFRQLDPLVQAPRPAAEMHLRCPGD